MTSRLDLAELSRCGAHQTGHFRLSSGLHSADYLQCALFLAYPRRAERVGALLAKRLDEVAEGPDVVVSPAIGGLIIGHETARALDVPFLFTERRDGPMVFSRGFALRPGQRVAVVEDVVTTGGSVHEVINAVEEQNGRVVAVAALIDRSGEAEPFLPLPFVSLMEVSFAVWEADDCPLCRDGVPIAKPGSRPVESPQPPSDQ